MNIISFGNCTICCTPVVLSAISLSTEDGTTLKIYFTPCEPAPLNGYYVQYRIHGSTGAYVIAGSFSTSPIDILTGDPPGTQYEGFLYSDCGNGNITKVAFETISNNCIYQFYDNESVGYSIFIHACATLPVTSPVTVVIYVTTQFETYTWTGIIGVGNTCTAHKLSYANGDGEALQLIAIHSISPASDSTYNYIECS